MQNLLNAEGKRRCSYQTALSDIERDGWNLVDKSRLNKDFYFQATFSRSQYAQLRDQPGSIGGIFCSFFTDSLCDRILSDIPVETWALSGSSNRRIIPRKAYIFKVFAAYIFIMDRRGIAEEIAPGRLDQDASMADAIAHLSQFCPNGQQSFPNKHIWRTLLAHYHIGYTYWSELSSNFAAALTSLGQIVAGDEKLVHFTGDSLFIRKVAEKPDRIGLWTYELCVRLAKDTPFLVYMRLHDASAMTGVHVPVHEIVQDWVEIVKTDPDNNVILVFESYYHSQQAHDLLINQGVSYIAACKEMSFQKLATVLEQHATRSGQYAIAWNDTSKEICVLHNHPDARLGKKDL